MIDKAYHLITAECISFSHVAHALSMSPTNTDTRLAVSAVVGATTSVSLPTSMAVAMECKLFPGDGLHGWRGTGCTGQATYRTRDWLAG